MPSLISGYGCLVVRTGTKPRPGLLERLLRIAPGEIGRRPYRQEITAPELDDLTHQAADDAVLAVMRRVHEFRGERRFTTWVFNASGPLPLLSVATCRA
jgi:hypothetical protein